MLSKFIFITSLIVGRITGQEFFVNFTLSLFKLILIFSDKKL